MKYTILTVTLAILLIFALTVPALAQSLSFTTSYEMDGVINLEKQAGHLCNTGAEIKQTITGSGVMDKVQTINMIEGRIMMEDDNNWVAGTTPLTVTTVWELCAPAKYVFTDEGLLLLEQYQNELIFLFGQELFDYLNSFKVGDPVPLDLGSFFGWRTKINSILEFLEEDIELPTDYEIAEALTDQIWAVQVQANPGFSGNLYQNGIAASGGYDGNIGREDFELDYTSTSEDWKIAERSSNWVFGRDKYGQYVPMVGPDFVGSYFNLEQHARTSQGTQRRYISLSSPWSHAYYTEDMSIVGKSDIKDSLALNNLPAGADMPGLWWDLF